MPDRLVQYARFVEAQQRRARIIAELQRSSTTAPRPTVPMTIVELIDLGEPVGSVDTSTPPGTVDVR